MLSGVACYDQWVTAFRRADYGRGAGDSYCYGIYRRTHRSAAGFLREIAPKYPQMGRHLEAAADHFEREADTLDSAESLLGWGAPDDQDAGRNKKVAEILSVARDCYGAGIGEIERALEALGE